MLTKIIYLLYLAVSKGQSETYSVIEEFIFHQNRPTSVVSFLDANSYMSTRIDYLPIYPISFQDNLNKVRSGEHTLFVADLNKNKTRDILIQAENKKLLRTPSRWMLFYNSQTVNSSHESNFEENSLDILENDKEIIEDILNDIEVGINTEVYIVVYNFEQLLLFSIYRRSINSSFVWEEYAVWTPTYYTFLARATLAMRRRDIQGLPVGAATVMTGNYSTKYFEDYLQRDIDTMAKYTHHMVKHLFEWVNGSGFVNYTNSWGYIQKDGRFNGVMREMEDMRADISGSPLVPSLDRLPIVEFIMYPAPIAVDFLFKKPTLAAVTNIFVLPFSGGVWSAAVGLIAICSFTLVVASFNEQLHRDENHRKQTLFQRISDCILDTLCLVFQQGTSQDPISLTARQILLLALLAFMFLFTAYSANVVALLQTTTNDVNSVEALLRSPLSLGVQDTIYNKYYFTTDTRPAHKALWKTKLQPHGDKAFLNIQEGIRRVRQGMYAYHVEQTAGFDEIQRTFLENEKCYIGAVKFIEARYPYISITRESPIREVLKIGIRRLMECGVQSRSTRRVIATPPKCGSSVAMFTAVTTGDVAPAFVILMITYAVAVLLLIAEIYVARKDCYARMLPQTADN